MWILPNKLVMFFSLSFGKLFSLLGVNALEQCPIYCKPNSYFRSLDLQLTMPTHLDNKHLKCLTSQWMRVRVKVDLLHVIILKKQQQVHTYCPSNPPPPQWGPAKNADASWLFSGVDYATYGRRILGLGATERDIYLKRVE